MKVLIITAALMLTFGTVYGCLRNKIGSRSLVFKALATLMAVYLGMYGSLISGGMSGTLITLGLVFCMAADVVLEINFIKGILLFGAAHVCYIAAYARLAHPKWYIFVCAAGIYSVIILVFRKDIKKLEELKAAAVSYMALLSLMSALALTLGISAPALSTVMIAAGAVCFVISDCLIALRTVRGKTHPAYGAVILLLYYGAVYLFGAAVYLRL